MFCLTLLISITLVACGSDNNNNNGAANNTDNNNVNNEDQINTNSEENEENEDLDTNSEENEDLDTNSEENVDAGTNSQGNLGSEDYEIDPTGENIVTLELEQNGVLLSLTYTADGDKVIEQTANNVMPYESLGVATQEEAEEILAGAVEGYQNAQGIEHEMDYQDDKVIETLTINYEEADMTEVGELDGTIVDGDTSQGISLTQSIDMLLQQGFEIVE